MTGLSQGCRQKQILKFWNNHVYFLVTSFPLPTDADVDATLTLIISDYVLLNRR